MDKLIIFDTTLRDGEQSPGASMTRDEKVRIALALERLRVDVIEAGFAISSQGDFEAVRAVAANVKDSAVCSLSRAVRGDIERSAEALSRAARPRIHTFIATSPLHMKHKLNMTPDTVLERAVDSVRHARNYVEDVEFSCEDSSRSELDFMCRVVEKAIEAGAATINLPDTVGYGEPEEYGRLIRRVMEKVPNSDKAVFSVHCHNDLGLAVANSLAAVRCGARQVECTINGLGERAGNASLEEIVMAVRTRGDVFGVETNIDATQIVPASRLVSGITGFLVQPNKAIVGSNAFAHEAGIHQDGVIKHRETYEIMRAEDVGWGANRLVLGKHSGRNAFRERLRDIGAGSVLDDEKAMEELFAKFKELADAKHEVFDEDLHALLNQRTGGDFAESYRLDAVAFSGGGGERPRAEVFLVVEGEKKQADAVGDGAVDAVFKSIEKMAHSGAHLLLYSVDAVTDGTDSQGKVTVRLTRGDRVVNGVGADTDIITASAKAYVNALNRLAAGGGVHPQRGI